jgi:glycosyltransferase involved in cell wall biosynthesis
MPRKGGEAVAAIRRALGKRAEIVEIDGLPEAEVARLFLESDLFVAISSVEAFGLPPLEAMCANCCVVGYPGDGGFEFLRHGETAHVVPNGDLRALVAAVGEVLARPAYREGLRRRGRAFAAYYTLEREREYLLRALALEVGP